MTTLTGAPPVSTASVGPMTLAPPPVSGEVYDDVKLLIEGLNKHAGPEGYASSLHASRSIGSSIYDAIVGEKQV